MVTDSTQGLEYILLKGICTYKYYETQRAWLPGRSMLVWVVLLVISPRAASVTILAAFAKVVCFEHLSLTTAVEKKIRQSLTSLGYGERFNLGEKLETSRNLYQRFCVD